MWQAFRRSKKNECSRTREMLSGYMDQRLNPEEVARSEEHLSTCQGCREELESLRATVALLHRLPEETPSRSFAVVPARPVPGRRALPALRFATAGVVLLLVLALAVDQTNIVERKENAGSYSSIASLSEGGEAYWVVQGELNTSVDPSLRASVKLIVPDGNDNVDTAVNFLAADGVIYGALESVPDEVPQLVLTEGDEQIISKENIEEFAVVTASSKPENRFATNDATTPFDTIMEGQDGSYLNILSSDNGVLYSFDLGKAQREVIAAQDNNWLRPLEYGLVGLVAVLAGVTAAAWLRQRRARVTEVSRNKN